MQNKRLFNPLPSSFHNSSFPYFSLVRISLLVEPLRNNKKPELLRMVWYFKTGTTKSYPIPFQYIFQFYSLPLSPTCKAKPPLSYTHEEIIVSSQEIFSETLGTVGEKHITPPRINHFNWMSSYQLDQSKK